MADHIVYVAVSRWSSLSFAAIHECLVQRVYLRVSARVPCFRISRKPTVVEIGDVLTKTSLQRLANILRNTSILTEEGPIVRVARIDNARQNRALPVS